MGLYYPEWFRVEKEAQEVINRLVNLKDLAFYLNNSNQYIRRQAILRLNQLKPLDSINILEQILNNPLEEMTNKKLAAWTIKTISLEHGLDLVISNPIIDNYTGKEQYHDLVNIHIIEPSILGVFSITPPPLYSELDLEEDYLIRDQEVDFETSFSARKWFTSWKGNFLSKTGALFKNIPLLLWHCLSKIMHIFWFKFVKVLYYKAVNNLVKLFHHHKHRINPIQIFKFIFFYLLFILLTPFRIIRQNKKLTFTLLVLILTFLYLKDGRQEMVVIFLKEQGFTVINNDFLTKTKDILTLAWTEMINISYLLLKKIKLTNTWQTVEDIFTTIINYIQGN